MKCAPWYESPTAGSRHLLWSTTVGAIALFVLLESIRTSSQRTETAEENEIGLQEDLHSDGQRVAKPEIRQRVAFHQAMQQRIVMAELVLMACFPIFIMGRSLRWAHRARNIFRRMIEKAPDALVIIDSTRQIRLINAQTTTLFGYSPTELIGQPVDLLIAERFRTSDAKSMTEPFGDLPTQIAGTEIAGLHRDGSEFPIELSVSPLRTDEGLVVAISIRDITGRVRLLASQERFELAVRGSSVGIWDWTIATNDLFMSARFKELLGYTDDELESSFATWRSQLHPDDVELVLASLNSHLTERAPYDVEHRIRHRSGEYRWHRSRGQAIWDEAGRAVRMAGSSSDITAKKLAEDSLKESLATIAATNRSLQEYANAAEAATLAKSEFLANMSHELRTPLNAIIGFSDGLLERVHRHPLNEHQKDRLAKIKRSGEHLLSLINNVLDISKIEAREQKVTPSHFAVASLVQEVIELADPLLRKKREVVLKNGCEANVPLIYSDRDKIKQILINLIGNAIKFTNKGRVTVRATVVDSRIQIRVEDTGIGVSAQDLPHLFDKFYQAKQIRTSFDGTGLGLSICKAFAELLGGSISVSSVEGSGSCFTVELPLQFEEVASADQQELIQRTRTQCSRTLSNRGPKVLCIDDLPSDQLIVNDILGESHCRVVPAFDGREGLQAVRDESPDVILLDVMLPGVDGWQILRQLKHDPEMSLIPVIVTSSLDDKTLGNNLGADEYYVKPLESSSLRGAVERLAYRWHRNVRHVAVVDRDPNTSRLIADELASHGFRVASFDDGEALFASLQHELPDALLLDLATRKGEGLDLLMRLEVNPLWRQIPVIVSTAKVLTQADLMRLNQRQVRAVIGKYSFNVEDWKLLLVRQVQKLEKGAIHEDELCTRA